MISNIPKSSEYEIAGRDCILHAMYMLHDYFNNNKEDKIIEYNQRVLRNAIILIYQGLEILLKSSICSHSALLLIDSKRSDWPTLPSCKKPKDFNEFNTIAGLDLLKTYFSTQNTTMSNEENESFEQFFDELRKKRNNLMHGLSNKKILPDDVLKLCLNSLCFYYGKTKWIQVIIEDIKLDPLKNTGNNDVKYFLYRNLNYFLNLLSLKELINYLLDGLTEEREKCSKCTELLNVYENELYANWTFKKNGKTTCIICDLI